MVGWWMDVAVQIIASHESKEPLGGGGTDVKKPTASEDPLGVEAHAESALKLHQTTKAVDLLVRHDPVDVVMVGPSKRKRFKKELSR